MNQPTRTNLVAFPPRAAVPVPPQVHRLLDVAIQSGNTVRAAELRCRRVTELIAAEYIEARRDALLREGRYKRLTGAFPHHLNGVLACTIGDDPIAARGFILWRPAVTSSTDGRPVTAYFRYLFEDGSGNCYLQQLDLTPEGFLCSLCGQETSDLFIYRDQMVFGCPDCTADLFPERLAVYERLKGGAE